jgi:ABC-type multidrug transport system ATPase subunit
MLRAMGPGVVAEGQKAHDDALVVADHVSFTVDEGESLGFLGPNRSGCAECGAVLIVR